MMITHYIGAFTDVLDGKQIAVCGTPTTEAAYSDEPSCRGCQDWIHRLSQPASSVVVTRPLGQTSYPDCVAAEVDGTIVVRTQSSGYLMDQIPAGKWVSCHVFRNGSPVPTETFEAPKQAKADHLAVIREYREDYARRFGGRQ